MIATQANKMDLLEDLTNDELKMEVHDRTHHNYDKSERIVKFFANKVLNHFRFHKDWNMEVWVNEVKSTKLNKSRFSCGVKLIRPHMNSLYVRKISNSLSNAIKESIYTLSNKLLKDSHQWKRS